MIGVETLSVGQISILLQEAGLHSLINSFAKHSIDGKKFMKLTDKKLKSKFKLQNLNARKSALNLVWWFKLNGRNLEIPTLTQLITEYKNDVESNPYLKLLRKNKLKWWLMEMMFGDQDDVRRWTFSDVVSWLDSNKLAYWIPIFQQKKINGVSLLHLNHQDVQEDLVISQFRQCKQLEESINNLKNQLNYKYKSFPPNTFLTVETNEPDLTTNGTETKG